MNYIA